MGTVPVYDPAAVEAVWQERWTRDRMNEPDLDHPARPFYNLMMFPYPSAEGLHVGNMFAFTGADIYGRFKRLQGFDVFEPIGFDAFGIRQGGFKIPERQVDVLLDRRLRIPGHARNRRT